MAAGLNLNVDIWRFTYFDDDVGGAVPSGTMTYHNVHSRRIDRLLRSRKLPELTLDDQGLETQRYNLFMLFPSTLDVRENDEITIISPPNHPDIGKFFRVITLAREGYHPSDPRGYLIVSTRRSVIAHVIQ